ncbi:MAG: hypothetical protein ACMG55_07505 [Microcoleus sp.]
MTELVSTGVGDALALDDDDALGATVELVGCCDTDDDAGPGTLVGPLDVSLLGAGAGVLGTYVPLLGLYT